MDPRLLMRRAWGATVGLVRRGPAPAGFPACVARLRSCAQTFAADARAGRESVRVARAVRGAAEDCLRTAAHVRNI